jgi:hypothetical protein
MDLQRQFDRHFVGSRELYLEARIPEAYISEACISADRV